MSAMYRVKDVWYLRIIIRTADKRKVIKRVSTGFTDESAARKVAGELEQKGRKEFDAQDSNNPPITLQAAITSFEISRKNKSHSTITTYRNILKKAVGNYKDSVFSFDPNTYLHEITSRDLAEYAEARSLEGLMPRSVALELKILIALHNHAKSLDYRINPNLVAKPPRPQAKTRTFTDADILAIIQKTTEIDPRASDLFIFLLETGCRISEVIEAQQEDFDLQSEVFTVHRRKTSSKTVLALSPQAHVILSKYISKAEPFRGFTPAIKVLRKIISEVCNTADRKRLIDRDGRATIHTTRHTYATRAVKAGNDLHTVSTILGHTMATMTVKYAHLTSLEASRRVLQNEAQSKHSKLLDKQSPSQIH